MRNLRWAALAVVSAIGLAVTAGPAAAAAVDQSSLPGDGVTMTSFTATPFTLPGQPYGFAQSFTVGQTGRLDAIAFGLLNLNTTARVVRLSIFTGVPTSLNAPLLYRGDFLAQPFHLAYGAFTDWSSLPTVDLRAANVQVRARQKLTFALTTMTSQDQLGLVDSVNHTRFNYDGGAKYSLINGRFNAFDAGDFAFRTFVTDPNAAAVPEPQTWALMIVGFALAGTGLRRRLTA